MVRRLLVLPWALFTFAFCAGAHAILTSSIPGARQVMQGPEISIKLTFNSRIDAKRSRLMLVSSDRSERPLNIVDQPSPEVLSSAAKGIKAGSYILRWQVLANDGHISRGEIPFSVQ
jgi:methionine-rich copper-binding protein CopC